LHGLPRNPKIAYLGILEPIKELLNLIFMEEENFIKLTKLCRISCTEEEKSAFLKSLDNILKYIEALQEVNTDNIPPCNTVLETLSNVMREDVPGETLSRESFLANALAHTGGMVRVPPVIKQE